MSFQKKSSGVFLRGATVMLTLALAGLGAGCISTEKTEYRDASRAKVEFENDTAGKDFYEGLAKLTSRHRRNESSTEVTLPIIFSHKHRVVDGENLVFNEAVRRCDTNGDSRITEQEARIFLGCVCSRQ